MSKITNAKWTHLFTPIDSKMSQFSNMNTTPGLGYKSTINPLPSVYQGAPNRILRYNQYDMMDRDTVINQCLNILAEFCSQTDQYTGLPFKLKIKDDLSDSQVSILSQLLDAWCYTNEFRTKMFQIMRREFIYGDQFFVRDPETYEWLHIDPRHVEKVTVDESKGKKIDFYYVRDIDLNLSEKTLTSLNKYQNTNYTGLATRNGLNNLPFQAPTSGFSNSRFQNSPNTYAIPAEHVIHLSLNSGLEVNWPFGTSILEAIFKTAKQKEMIEDSMVIYTVQRAPERRVFYVDVGDKPAHTAMTIIERLKNEALQKRIPSRSANGNSAMDAAYNPMSVLEDYYIPVNSQGKGTKVELLNGGDPNFATNGLMYFNNLIIRGLGIPSSYIPMGVEDSSNLYNDGKIGTAFLQEFRFAQTCKRLQNMMIGNFDYEFKLYLKHRDINIPSSKFQIEFIEPQSFGEYRQIEKDKETLDILSRALGIPFISKRFALKRFGGLSETELVENERLWMEENPSKKLKIISKTENDLSSGLKNVGIEPTYDDNIGHDFSSLGSDDSTEETYDKNLSDSSDELSSDSNNFDSELPPIV